MCGIWAVFGSDEDIYVQCNSVHKVSHRGPDAFRIESIHLIPNCCLGFHRLAINDDLAGMQPLRVYRHPHIWLIYNGEIYNYKLVRKEFDFPHDTESDGEVIIDLYHHGGIEFAAKHLDGTFAFILLNTANRKVFLGRDTFGVRPLFRYSNDNGFLAVCSEVKGILGLTNSSTYKKIDPLLPGHIETYSLDDLGKASLDERLKFNEVGEAPFYKTLVDPVENDTKKSIRILLEDAVKKRLMSDRRIGCFLSGGLDSSLITALLVKIAKKQGLKYPIQTFSVGMEGSPDTAAAKKVAKYLNTEHHEIIFTSEEGTSAIRDVIYHLENFDLMTIRSSIAMYLLSKYVKEKTDTTVILSGEGSDEIGQGYIYFHKAPTAEDADEESRRLSKDLHLYDVCRGDRSTAAWGLEIRVPFLDHKFSSYYLSLPLKARIPRKGVEKYLLRSAFDSEGLLPEDILWRPKEGFSDGLSTTSRSWHEVLQDFIDKQIDDSELEKSKSKYPVNPPKTKEALYYRNIFEEFCPGMSHLTPYFWYPKWAKAADPSARALEHYKQ